MVLRSSDPISVTGVSIATQTVQTPGSAITTPNHLCTKRDSTSLPVLVGPVTRMQVRKLKSAQFTYLLS
jgi:hypothetical protein